MSCSRPVKQGTVKFLNFRTRTKFTVNTLKFNLKRFYHCVIPLNDANGIANSLDPDQTAPLGAV